MKRTFFILICSLILGSANLNVYGATTTYINDVVYDPNGEKISSVRVAVSGFNVQGNPEAELDREEQDKPSSEDIFKLFDNYECLWTYDFKTTDSENLYPEIDEMTIKISRFERGGGGLGEKLGKNYKLYYIDNGKPEEITASADEYDVTFKANKLGTYAMYFDEASYNVNFYADQPEFDEDDGHMILEPFFTKEFKARENVTFPEKPTKDGYVFCGWTIYFNPSLPIAPSPQPHKPERYGNYFASWCKAEDYNPLKIEISSDEDIIKGEEDGKVITLKISDGFFLEDNTSVTYLDNWAIKGCEGISIAKIERMDYKTLQITLSGNSSDIYTDSNIYFEFPGDIIDFEYFDSDDNEVSEDKKFQLDSDGIPAKVYVTDNKVKLQRQARKSTGGSLSGNKAPESKKYTVTFDTNGGSTVDKMTIEENSSITEPTAPTKEGYTFDGWYTDKELSSKYDFAKKVSGNITLYAKWNEQKSDDTKTDDGNKADSKIILTIGKNDATVFGESKTNDVAPIIRNDRTMLPARFVAESLGAKVIWDADKKQVTVTGKNNDKDVEIIITIDSDKATVNGETIELDSPAFIENDRTYTPIRFIAEQLGATVEWNEADQTVIINRA